MNFFHDLNIAVITSRFVITHNSPIIYVFHNHEDGIWEFYGVEDLKEDDYRVVSLAEILKSDSSIFGNTNLKLEEHIKLVEQQALRNYESR